MEKPLSFSAYKRFTTCPKFYEYHDIKKDRPGKMSSALHVGTFLDTVICDILEKKGGNPVLQLNALIANVRNDDMDFFTDDLDLDLISKERISKVARDLGWKGDNLGDALKDLMKDQTNLSVNQRKLLNAATWDSLQVKCQAMLASFQKWILPQIKEVHEIQTHLDNGKVHGYLDFIVTLTDGRKVLFDLKTSKMPYKKDAVLTSPQLSLYAAMKDVEYAGFIVLVKNLNKNKEKSCSTCNFTVSGGNRVKCPTCKTNMNVLSNPTSFSQLLVDKVSKWNKDLTTEALHETIQCIDNGVFPRNLNQCQYMYGKPCLYIDKCWKGKK